MEKEFFKQIQSYEIIGEFESINGLLENAVVKYRGYPVGRVTKITPKTKHIEVYFFVDSKFDIPFGSTVKIIFDGLVGEKYMEIIPNKHETQMLANGARITGYSSSGLSDFIEVGTDNLKELQQILKTMANVFGTEETSHALKEILYSMKDAANNMERVIKELSKISNSNRISSILKESETFLKSVNAALSEEDFDRLNQILVNFESFSNDLKEITGDGKLKSSIISTLDETRYTFEKSNTVISTISKIKLLTSADFNYKMLDSESYLTYLLNMDFYLNKSYLNIGFGNYFKYDRLINATINSYMGDSFLVKYGVIKSTPGLGYSQIFKSVPFSYSFDFYNLEDPYLDFSLSYLYSNDFKFMTGFNEFNKESKSIFFGFSFLP